MQTQRIFELAEKDCQRWLEDVLGQLKTQMKGHKVRLDRRTKNLTGVRASTEALEYRLAIVEAEYVAITKQSQSLDTMLLQLMKAVQAATQKVYVKLDRTLRLPEMTFLNVAEASFSETI